MLSLCDLKMYSLYPQTMQALVLIETQSMKSTSSDDPHFMAKISS